MFKKYIAIIAFLCMYSCATDDMNTSEEQEAMETEEVITEEEENNLVFEGDVRLINQDEVDTFGAIGYTEITGDLEIVNTITSLLPLNTLEIIGGDLLLGTTLGNFEGLDNITSIGESLRIEYNNEVTTLEHLSGISSSVRYLSLIENVSLTTLEGLENITIQSGGIITLTGNISLESATSLENGIPENLRSFSIRPLGVPDGGGILPTPLTDLSFLSNVTTLDFLYLQNFQGGTLQGLNNMVSCADFAIIESPFIEDMSGLENLQDVNDLSIGYNLSLNNLDGLDNLVSITGDNFNIFQNSQLTDFCALENLFVNGEYSEVNYTINDNAFNPTIQDIIDGNCSN